MIEFNADSYGKAYEKFMAERLDLKTQLNNGARVSTVLLPSLAGNFEGGDFETMVFSEGNDGESHKGGRYSELFCQRHTTEDAAREEHVRTVDDWEGSTADEVAELFKERCC